MCGICGTFDIRNELRADNQVISKMMSKLIHRGPDGSESYVEDNVSLGFTRLSIIDLEGGMQPIFNENNSIVLVCNGEIFNYKEIRKELEEKGHRFKTHSDVEVILHLYEDEGTGFINKLNGQFAFCIFDKKENIMLCARDHVGIIPFFYTVRDGIFIFGSEIKAILEHPYVTREVDLVSLDQMMTFPGVLSPRTMFKGISSLECGHYLVVKCQGEILNNEYWDLCYPKIGEMEYSHDESYYCEKLEELLTRAVRYRLQADVPVGFYISGGLDSSIIAAKIKEVDASIKRHSFSIDFTEKEISEAKYQRLVSEYVNSIHHEKLFNFDDLTSRLEKVVYHSESALKETYNTSSMALSELVRQQNLKVVLTGEGADELFAGYVGYRFDRMRKQTGKQATPDLAFEDEIRRNIWGDEDFIYEKNYFEYQKTKQELYSDNINSAFDEINCLNYSVINKSRLQDIDILHKRSYVDFKLRLPEHLLADHGDRMGFANSVEARYPFLDKDLVDFATKIPPDMKLKGFDEKHILKRIAENLIPKEIIKRPKFSYVAPGSPQILRQNVEYINDILSYETIKRQGFFNPDEVEELKKKYSQENFRLNLPYDNDMLIMVITFGIFMEKFKMSSIN